MGLFVWAHVVGGSLPCHAQAAGPLPHNPEIGSAQDSKRELRRPKGTWVLLSLLSGLGNGVAATVYAYRGDEAYAKYTDAETIADAEKFWNETASADRVRNTTAWLSAVSFAASAYLGYRYYQAVKRYNLEKEKVGLHFKITPLLKEDAVEVVLAYDF